MKTQVFLFAALVLFAACSPQEGGKESGLSVVTTIFPPYDFVRAIAGIPDGTGNETGGANRTAAVHPGQAGSGIRLRMLLKPGAESHSWEPSPQDLIAIQKSDVFIYGGGESDAWISRVLSSMDISEKKIIALMDCVETVEEEIVEGMAVPSIGAEEEGAYDEHVWTSPLNAKRIVERISQTLCAADPENAPRYRANTAAYLAELDMLDAEFRSIVNGAPRRTLVFADRFPFRYFTDRYGLRYYAAFPGCSTDTEPSAAAVAFLIDKIKEEKIPLVLYIEFSNRRMADAVSEAAGAGERLFHSAHNVSRDELSAGTSYVEIMRRNAEVLREALW